MPKTNKSVAELSRTAQWRIRRAVRRDANPNILDAAVGGDRNEDNFGRNEAIVERQHNEGVQHQEVPAVNAEQAHQAFDGDNQPHHFEEDDNALPQENGQDVQDHGHDEEDENASEDEENDYADNEPLYQGAPVTVRESLMLVLSLMLNHNLTGSCISDVLSVINLHCRRENLKTLTMYHFRKFFSPPKANLVKKFYCCNCNHSLARPDDECRACHRVGNASYFIHLPIIPQLKEMYRRQSFHESLQHRFNRNKENPLALEDIYDGALYRDMIGNGFLFNRNNISFTWYTDGAPVYNSRNYSIWPFIFIINELPYKLRVKRENILLTGLWFGPKKPAANLFMSAFLPELRSLYAGVPFTCAGLDEPLTVSAVVLAGVCDAPAKSTFLNFHSHAGFYGCPACEIRGETLRREGETDKHVFRYVQPLVKRTVHRVEAQAQQAVNTGEAVMGVKGPTYLRVIMPNFIRGIAMDPMHLVLGVVKKLLMLFFSPECSAYPFSLRPVMQVLDELLLSIKPPKFIHRKPSSVEHFNRWKASELKSWLFYYSLPVLKAFMRADCFDHYLKFVIAISHLYASSVSIQMIDNAEQLLINFVRDFEELYDVRFSSINIHMLLHLADCVRELGPLWVYSCFPMENLNGLLLNTVHGKTNVETQVCNSYWQFLNMTRKLQDIGEGDVKEFCLKRRRSVHINERIAPSCHVVGYFKSHNQNDVIIACGLRTSNIAPGRMYQYFRLLKDRLLYVADEYSRDVVSQSCFVVFETEAGLQAGSVYSFLKLLRCNCQDNCECNSEHYAIIRVAERVRSFRLDDHNSTLNHLHQYRMTIEVRAIPVTCLKTVCVYMAVFGKVYIAEPINPYEFE